MNQIQLKDECDMKVNRIREPFNQWGRVSGTNSVSTMTPIPCWNTRGDCLEMETHARTSVPIVYHINIYYDTGVQDLSGHRCGGYHVPAESSNICQSPCH